MPPATPAPAPAPAPGYRPYPSSLDPTLQLFATFYPQNQPVPIVLTMHGWHGSGKIDHADDVLTKASPFFTVIPDMRGRADSAGHPDANAVELQDAVDAIAAAARLYPGSTGAALVPRVIGGSGGGSNVLGMLGKFPDHFSAAVCECGVSDFALWFAHDQVGEFRDEMEGKDWIGGTPWTNPEAYISRGGRTNAMNLMVPLLMFHGDVDPRVPVAQPRAYIAAARKHGREHLIQATFYPNVGHPGHYGGLAEEELPKHAAAIQAHLARHTSAPQLPEAGRLVVAGFLRTRRFAIELESAGQVAILDYALGRGEFRLRAPSCRVAKLAVQSAAPQLLACQKISLEAFCDEVGIPLSPGA